MHEEIVDKKQKYGSAHCPKRHDNNERFSRTVSALSSSVQLPAVNLTTVGKEIMLYKAQNAI